MDQIVVENNNWMMCSDDEMYDINGGWTFLGAICAVACVVVIVACVCFIAGAIYESCVG